MELIKEATNVKKYKEDNNIFTMINMGDFINHKNRDLLTPTPIIWKLIFLEKDNISIEGLIDSKGNYIRFIVKLNEFRRVIGISNNMVFQDFIAIQKDKELPYESIKSLIDNDIYSKENIELNDYLETKITTNNPNEHAITDNNLISEFLEQSLKLEQKENKMIRTK